MGCIDLKSLPLVEGHIFSNRVVKESNGAIYKSVNANPVHDVSLPITRVGRLVNVNRPPFWIGLI